MKTLYKLNREDKKYKQRTANNAIITMHRILIILLTTFSSAISMGQSLPFDKAARQLFFETDIIKASSSLVDTLLAKDFLHHNNNVIRRINLDIDSGGWDVTHTFEFTKSPLLDFKIKSGRIKVILAEANKVKKLQDVNLSIDFNSQEEANLFFDYLRKTFEPLSANHKVEYEKGLGYFAQYSSKEQSKGIRYISFIFGKSRVTKNYDISVSLKNFLNE